MGAVLAAARNFAAFSETPFAERALRGVFGTMPLLCAMAGI
jgi:hypothetical protein